MVNGSSSRQVTRRGARPPSDGIYSDCVRFVPQPTTLSLMAMNYRLAGLVLFQLFAVAAISEVSGAPVRPQNTAIWTVPEVGALPHDAYGLQVRDGRDLVTATYAYIGPNVPDASKRYAGNNLDCANCHLEAGTKKFGLPLFGLYN